MLLTKVQQSAGPIEYLCRLAGAALRRACGDRIPRPATGKIAAIVRVAATLHRDLVAVVEMHDSPRRQQEGLSHHELCRIAAGCRQESRLIMISGKDHEHLRMQVQRVL